MKTCFDVMTSTPICCLPDDNLVDVAACMREESIGSLPVIENFDTHKLIGIITDRDLALRVIADDVDPKTTLVEKVMTRVVVTCQKDDPVQSALDAMALHQVRRIVIVDQNHQVLGIISQADVATRINRPEKTAELVKEISQSTEISQRNSYNPVFQVMPGDYL